MPVHEYTCPLCPPGVLHTATSAHAPHSCPEHRAEWRRRRNTELTLRRRRLAAGLDPDYDGSYGSAVVADPAVARAVAVLANAREAQALAAFAWHAAGQMTPEQHRQVYRWLADTLEDLTAPRPPSPHPLA